MKKMVLLFILALPLMGCPRSVTVGGDEEVVLVEQPWFFGHGGVSESPVSAGQKWVAPTTGGIGFKITPIQYKEIFDDLVTDDNTPVDFDAYLELQAVKGQTPRLYKQFGEQWYVNNVSPGFRKLVRDKASTYKMFDLAGNREVLNELEKFVFEGVQTLLKDKNLPVGCNRVVIGAVLPPPEVLEETRRTAAQNQSILTQDARAKAELARKQAEVNKAIADKAYQNQMNMTVADYLHLRALEIEKEKVELIRDKQEVSIIFGGGVPLTYPVK